ncbi:uncharacterized protein si:ch211-13c6.2 [Trichomycterus rosablanca]|uniref:uncharacterized protein si:ch211-13c6.2 n=1 Tax=Trichomycterus rosablanca TaxID=2290929 RepID=UPI002F34F3E3
MADLQTVHDNKDGAFVHCTACNKRMKGGIHYEIHRTTLQHLKKEEALAAMGLIPSPPLLPEWTDITQYLKYLNLDEPIIGLSALEQVKDLVTDNSRVLLKYRCTLCEVETDLYCTVIHVVGRKHRQKYLEQKRPDLLTWTKNSPKQPELLKATAAVVEEQEGWGEPGPLPRPEKAKHKRNQGNKKEQGSRPSARRRVSTERERSRRGEDFYRRSYLTDDTHGRSLSYCDDNLYDESYRDSKVRRRSNLKDDKYDTFYTRDGRHKRSYDDNYRREAPYGEEDTNMGSYSGPASRERRYIDEAVPQSYSDERQDKYCPEIKPSGRKHDFYRDSISKNRYGEFGSALHTDVYGSYQERGSSMDEMQIHGKNFQYSKDEREHFPAMERSARAGSFEMRGYRQGQRYFPDEDIPAKKPRTSRFSDDSPLEMDFAHKRSTEAIIPDNTVTGKNVDWGVTQFTPKMENVLDVLNNIEIENVQEANFLKERLCTLIKEFQSNKALQAQKSQVLQSSSTFTDYSNMGSNYIDQLKDMLEQRRSSHQEFQESARYGHDSRRFEDNFNGLQEQKQFEINPRDFPEAKHFKEERRQFPDMMSYENGTLQESGRYKSDYSDFQFKFKDNPTSFQQTRGFGDSTKDYLHTRHYIEDRQAFTDRSQDFEYGSKEDPRRKNRGSEKSRHGDYDQMFTDSWSHSKASQRDLGSSSQTNFKKEHGKCHWDVSRTGTAEQPEDYTACHPADEKSYQERWRQHYQHDYGSAGDVSDTFESSSSHKEAGHSSSLNNLASTLLQLVARKTN